MHKIYLFLFLISTFHYANANMASPWQRGTQSASAYSSNDLDIIHEHILIAVNNDFSEAKYTITYTIQSSVQGNQIPLVFYAMDYVGDFQIWLDDTPVTWQQIIDQQSNDSLLIGYNYIFKNNAEEDTPLTIFWGKENKDQIESSDLKYFVADLSAGTHTIRVQYTAEAWVNSSEWVKNYSFRYALSPAKYWKSFGGMDIDIQVENSTIAYSTNLGTSQTNTNSNMQSWKFKTIPEETLVIDYTPEISSFAMLLIKIEPFGLAIIFSVLLFILHLTLIFRYRKKHPTKSIAWFISIGSVFIPIIAMIFYMYSFGLIDNAIGTGASRFHGYTFMVLMILPLAVPAYYLLIVAITKITKHLQKH
ncbi:MAG: hypothetical protein KBF51_02940 [Chitinophagales bacterium]|nr:hypothetical protein [Bacteroidota bacterium]MBP8753460.1 hypothetical protein [Chitinophagales bacterium]MBP9188467.1 hypothetical protein [Chitinophagales bacterium]